MVTGTMPATINATGLSRVLECTDKHIRNLDKAGKLPEPIRLGVLKRWVRSDIDLWLNNGCPDRETFAQIKAKQS